MSEHRDTRTVARQLLPWTLAGVCAIGVVWFGQAYFRTKTENNDLQTRRAIADFARQTAEVQSAAEKIMSDRMAGALKAFEAKSAPTAASTDATAISPPLTDSARHQTDLTALRIATLTAKATTDSRQPLATLVWNPSSQDGILNVQHLPPLSRSLTYELWLAGEVPVSAGAFRVDDDGRARVAFKPAAPVSGDVRFLVSRAPADGRSYHATPGEIVLTSE